MLVAAAATSASAATISVDAFDRTDTAGALAARNAFLAGSGLSTLGIDGDYVVTNQATETFGGHQAWNGATGTTNPAGTNVGSFSQIGAAAGFGLSAINGGTGLEVRSDAPMFGRQSLLGSNWLDSNDTFGIRWDVAGPSSFNSLAFFLTDVADVGAKFSLSVGGTLFENIIGQDARTADGTIHFVRILLPELVDATVVELRHDRLNDGFGIDGATVAHIAPVPVPPAAALLVSGIVVLAAVRRRRARAAA